MSNKRLTFALRLTGAASVLAVVISAFLLRGARMDWIARDCGRWPESGQCHVAVASQWLFGSLAAVGLLIAACAFWVSRNA